MNRLLRDDDCWFCLTESDGGQICLSDPFGSVSRSERQPSCQEKLKSLSGCGS